MATYSEENTVNIVERDSKYVLDREGHHRYLRLRRALIYLKEALHEPVLSEINKLHSKVKEKIPKETKNVNDQISRLKGQLYSYLNKSNESNKIYINNVNIEKWEDQPWETAKAFMPAGQKESNKSPKDTDIMGILRLISGCMKFDNWLKHEVDGVSGHKLVQEVLKVRNLDGHPNSLCCTETEVENGIRQIKKLMEYLKQRFKGFVDDDNVSEDDKRIYRKAEMEMEDALGCVEKVKTDTDFDVMIKLVVEDICKSRAYKSSNETQRKEIAKVQFRYATRKIFMSLNDLWKENSKKLEKHLRQQETLESFITDTNTDVMFLLAALEEKQMFQAENLDDLLHLIEPLIDPDQFQHIETSVMMCKTTWKWTLDITPASALVYDVFILHCEDDREKANIFRQDWLDSLKDLKPPAKTILYDEYVLPGTSHVSALDNVLEDCRLVFILCTQAFMKDSLSRFQAEMVMYNNLEKKNAPRVIPVHYGKEDLEHSPSWIRVMNPFCVFKYLESNTNPTPLMTKIKDGREKYLKSCQ